jgi:NAD(P)-dependent dehydrogenase (short-subunit alcohol dehydrogenase family)
VGAQLWQRRPATLAGQVALITGASRGLGLLLAHEFAREGCRIAICARDYEELTRAQRELVAAGATVLAVPCNVADPAEVDQMIMAVTNHYGRIDILVNNAGLIQVAPFHNLTMADFEEAMGVMYWSILYTVWAVLPQMRQRQSGRIVNITSIGGKVSVPHLLPYNSAKFAAVGLSEGLRAELADDGIRVTTIVPGLMRTGSHLNAQFKGQQAAEYTWFSLGASLPFISMDAARAARQIVAATRRGDAERTLSLPAQLLARVHGLFPGFTANVLGAVDRFVLPNPGKQGFVAKRGMAVEAELTSPHAQMQKTLTTLGREAAERLNQYPGG